MTLQYTFSRTASLLASRRSLPLSSKHQQAKAYSHFFSTRLSRSPNGLILPRSFQPFPTLSANNHQRCKFSSENDTKTSTSSTVLVPTTDLSTMSNAQLHQLAMKYARQNNPLQAQVILDLLVDAKADDSVSEKELSILQTSIIDAWIQYQTGEVKKLYDSSTKEEDDIPNVQLRLLEDICHAAESVTQLVDSMSKPSPHHRLATLTAWANVCEAARNSGHVKSDLVRGIPQRTQRILDSQDNDNAATSPSKPSAEMVNQVIRAWAYSGEHLRGTMAEQVFQKYLTGSTVPGSFNSGSAPTGDSFRYIMRAWCWSKERRCAFTATGHYMRMMRLLEMGRSDMEPTLEDYHILFHAWTTAEDKNAPSKVQTVLQIADNVYRKGHTEVRPDADCYRDALITMSKRVNVPEVGELVDGTLMEMKKSRMMIPTTECYGAAILAWKNVATARECKDREQAIQRSYDLLQEMVKAFHRTTTVTVRPSTVHYNTVLEALAFSKSGKAASLAKKLLKDLEEGASATTVGGTGVTDMLMETQENFLSPDADSYKYALNVLRNSKRAEKVNDALEIVGQMKKRSSELVEQSNEDAVVDAFSSFILVCAHSGFNDDSLRMKTMNTTLKTLGDIRLLGLTPNSSTYAALLEACNHLVSDGRSRQRILEYVFRTACEEGYVDQAVLESFKEAASTYLYAKLVVSASRQVEHMKVVPESWTRSVKGFLAKNVGGRKVLPLTIEGKFTFTKAAAEYKMRKLRRKTNKHMLQGGRT